MFGCMNRLRVAVKTVVEVLKSEYIPFYPFSYILGAGRGGLKRSRVRYGLVTKVTIPAMTGAQEMAHQVAKIVNYTTYVRLNLSAAQ